ncbi:cholinesterase [Cadophora sp. DSE1049]|nr:cholinesterase [Cadophora sp. DSE1049]
MIPKVYAFLALVGARVVVSVPSTSRIGSDVTILTDNDLYGNPETYESAIRSCALLSEGLWSPDTPGQAFNLGLNNSLSYQQYIGTFSSSQKLWIASPASAETNSKKPSCSAIDVRGRTSYQDCKNKLPVLCTQSAPISTAAGSNTSTPFQVPVQAGKQTLTGFRDLHAFTFLGVRFAPQPPRLGYSHLFIGSESTTALQPGPACVQAPSTGNEDCLFLNVWTPYLPSSQHKTAKKKLKAVMVWIFGGGFVGGYGYDPGTDGVYLASRGDVVVVTLNHRVGVLGFLALKDGTANGNYGIADIVTALKWVREYIESFGGDPDRVTVFGQSSGAAAIRALIASPEAKGLVHAAIMQSAPGGFSDFDAYTHYGEIEDLYKSVTTPVLSAVGCLNVTDQPACLKVKDAYELIDVPVLVNTPTIDGTYIVSPRLSLTGEEYAARIPILTGTNRDESGITAPYPAPASLDEALAEISGLLKLNLSYIPSTGAFPVPAGPDPTLNNFNVTSRIITDGGLHCLNQATAFSGVKHKVFPVVYSYVFNRTYQPPTFTNGACNAPITPSHPFGDPNMEYLKCHAGDVIWPFGLLQRLLPVRDEIDMPFSQLILDYWTSFARTHDPNPEMSYLKARGYWGSIAQLKVAGRWDQVKTSKPAARWLQWNGKQVPFDEKEQCDALGLPLDYYELL